MRGLSLSFQLLNFHSCHQFYLPVKDPSTRFLHSSDSTRLSTSTSGSPIKTRKIQDDPTSLKFQSSSIFLNKFSSGCSSLSIAFSTCFVLL
ncbi:hypothetical protein PGTUg99_031561 [Puccinia graminis f. sp. tritici]|uniref:Uncharacterized protein n=1 Tax=Puccinia graminis f. sp. tritici TaxID=56615 RepID=A0A5B0NWX3_PUCGR|nr:hypothetical protein PGTUg99_031561 [Puccinia graminis f. sp. tritici]